ncbi:tyrosine-type recombinase/integrase [Desulfoluna butyratoxydans]|uniref:Integrase catalytic domain n=1 Tax=Desulfoluna butyratoxydans TaxID=231438 RepID=A0A4U8YTR1_9BACT|nr:site-specific integrase [Desulfoluna butyratoxydans]VFQ47370.1 integrase catalytic domain [Desulfoluna butyratoxydans]
MAVKLSYRVSMPKLWRHPDYDTFYALWQEGPKRRRKALCMPGSRRATKDPKLAQKLFTQFTRQLMAGQVAAIKTGHTVSFGAFKKEFLDYVETNRSEGTFLAYKQGMDKASSCWGDTTDVNQISTRHLDKLGSDLFRSGLAPATVNKHYRHVKAALKKAMQWEYIDHPIIFPKPVKEPKSIRYIPKEHMARIMAHIEEPEFYDFCTLSCYLGLRNGEALRLTLADVDNPPDYLRIVPLQKNRKESRVPINATARETLSRCMARAREKKRQKIFHWTSRTHTGQKFKRAVRAAGFEHYRFHDLRHTFASYLAMGGANLQAIQELMRHESMASTLIYSKLSPDHLKAASEQLCFTLGPMPFPTGTDE